MTMDEVTHLKEQFKKDLEQLEESNATIILKLRSSLAEAAGKVDNINKILSVYQQEVMELRKVDLELDRIEHLTLSLIRVEDRREYSKSHKESVASRAEKIMGTIRKKVVGRDLTSTDFTLSNYDGQDNFVLSSKAVEEFGLLVPTKIKKEMLNKYRKDELKEFILHLLYLKDAPTGEKEIYHALEELHYDICDTNGIHSNYWDKEVTKLLTEKKNKLGYVNHVLCR
jgi:hypothetical protein